MWVSKGYLWVWGYSGEHGFETLRLNLTITIALAKKRIRIQVQQLHHQQQHSPLPRKTRVHSNDDRHNLAEPSAAKESTIDNDVAGGGSKNKSKPPIAIMTDSWKLLGDGLMGVEERWRDL